MYGDETFIICSLELTRGPSSRLITNDYKPSLKVVSSTCCDHISCATRVAVRKLSVIFSWWLPSYRRRSWLTTIRSTESGMRRHPDTHHLYERTFAAAGPRLWNSLPPQLKDAHYIVVHSYSPFRRSLKTSQFRLDSAAHGAVWTILFAPFRYTLYLLTYLGTTYCRACTWGLDSSWWSPRMESGLGGWASLVLLFTGTTCNDSTSAGSMLTTASITVKLHVCLCYAQWRRQSLESCITPTRRSSVLKRATSPYDASSPAGDKYALMLLLLMLFLLMMMMMMPLITILSS